MILMAFPLFFVALSLFVFLEYIDALPLDQIATCGNTELCFLQSDQLPEINCDCSPSGTQCSWSRFVDRREILSNGITESVLMWQRTGYGQYICVRDNSTEARNIMILPEARDQSCDDCINTRVCIIAARTYLNFTLLFDQSLISGECELLLNGIFNRTITERSCVKLFSNLNYSIRCPICQQGEHNINHVIPNSIFTNSEDCFDSDICNTIFPTSSTAVATTVSSIATSVLTVTTSPSFPTASSSTSTVVTPAVTLTSVTTTMLTASSTSGKPNGDGLNTRAVIGVVVGGVVGGIIVIFLGVVLVCYIKHKRNSRQSQRQLELQLTSVRRADLSESQDTVASTGDSNHQVRRNSPHTHNNGVATEVTSEAPNGKDKPDDDTTTKKVASKALDKPDDDATKKVASKALDKPNDDATKKVASKALDKPDDDATKKATSKPDDDASTIKKATFKALDKPDDDTTKKATSKAPNGMDNALTSKVTSKPDALIDQNLVVDQPSVGQSTEDQTLLQQSKITDNTLINKVILKTPTKINISNNVDTNEVFTKTSADTFLSKKLCNEATTESNPTICDTKLDTGHTSQILNQLAPAVSSSINLNELMPFLQKHELLTNDEIYDLTNPATAPGKAAQLLLRILKSKGDGTLQKFLCSLNSERRHLGHKDIATKLSKLINRHHHQGLQMQFCPLCTTDVV